MQQSLSQGHDWHWSNAINASSNCVTIKDIKENPGENLEELLSHMDTNDYEHKGTKDFNLAQKIVSMESRTISLTTALQK